MMYYMTLYIDTTQNNLIEFGLKQGKVFMAKKKFSCRRAQAEKLLSAIEKLLKANKLKLSGLDRVEVANQDGSFTSLRIGVVTANALAYALGIPVSGSQKSEVRSRKFSVVEPVYGREPEITVKKKVCG